MDEERKRVQLENRYREKEARRAKEASEREAAAAEYEERRAREAADREAARAAKENEAKAEADSRRDEMRRRLTAAEDRRREYLNLVRERACTTGSASKEPRYSSAGGGGEGGSGSAPPSPNKLSLLSPGRRVVHCTDSPAIDYEPPVALTPDTPFSSPSQPSQPMTARTERAHAPVDVFSFFLGKPPRVERIHPISLEWS